MKKLICIILLITLSSSNVIAQFSDQVNKKVSVTNEVLNISNQSRFLYLTKDMSPNFLMSDSLKNQSYTVWYPFDTGTIIIQTLGGVFGAVLGGFIAFAPAALFCRGPGCVVVVLAIPLGCTLGISFAVDMSGDEQGGNGSFGFTLLGAVIGIASHLGIVKLALPNADFDIHYLYPLVITVVGGAIIGYHLSAHPAVILNQTSIIQFEKNKIAITFPAMKINRYEYPTTSYGISAKVLSINF